MRISPKDEWDSAVLLYLVHILIFRLIVQALMELYNVLDIKVKKKDISNIVQTICFIVEWKLNFQKYLKIFQHHFNYYFLYKAFQIITK